MIYSVVVGISSYDREIAFRAIGEKHCPFCGRRKSTQIVFCSACESHFTPGIMMGLRRKESLRWRGMWRHDWRDPEEKFTFAVCAVALVIVIAKVWFD